MSNVAGLAGCQARARIELDEPFQVSFWTNHLRIDEETLRMAVDAVGPSVESVRQYVTGYPSPDLRQGEPG
jgi:hypothetical protein